MILVTGSAGFIGSNLCFKLHQQGHSILGIDRISKQSNREWTESIESGPNRMVFRLCDLRDWHGVRRIFEEYPIEKVVHLAAESHVDRSISDPGGFWEANVLGTQNLMQACLQFGVEVVINQITDEVYGEKPTGDTFEGDQFAATSPYACSKVAQYWVGHSFQATHSLPVISTFPANCFGPRQHAEKLVPKFIEKLLRGEKVPLMKSTKVQRDWLPVDDMCEALALLLTRGIPGGHYNIGANNHRTNWAMTCKLLELCDRDMDSIDLVEDRKAHDCRYSVSSGRIKQLGWSVTNSFDDYLKYTVDWYKQLWQYKTATFSE